MTLELHTMDADTFSGSIHANNYMIGGFNGTHTENAVDFVSYYIGDIETNEYNAKEFTEMANELLYPLINENQNY